MNLIDDVKSAVNGNWDNLKYWVGKDFYSILNHYIDTIPALPTFEDLWIRVNSLLFIKDCPKPIDLKKGDMVYVFENGNLVTATIVDQAKDNKRCYVYRTSPDSRLTVIHACHRLWGVHQGPLPEFTVEMEVDEVKKSIKIEYISCCGLHQQCQAAGKCISNSEQDRGVKYNCALGNRLFGNQTITKNNQEPKIETIPSPELLITEEKNGQLSLF